MLTLESNIKDVTRVGLATANNLKKLGINTVYDLLFYFPFRYDDYSELTKIESLTLGEKVNIVAQIELIQNKKSPRRRMNITEALVNDGTESLKAIWFNQPYIARNLKTGDMVSLAGKVEEDFGGMVMMSPNYEKVSTNNVNTQGFVPVYHLTLSITQKQLRFLIKQVIWLSNQVNDWLPSQIKKNLNLCDLSRAIHIIHFPKNKKDYEIARERLAFDEIFILQMQSSLVKREIKQEKARVVHFQEMETKKLVSSLPFALTDAQKKASWAILQDLGQSQPMARMLQGDVGSGKTIVALLATLNTALNGYQVVFLVPTEILAKQHYENICKLLVDFDIKVGLVTRSEKKMNNVLSIMYNEKENKIDKKRLDTKHIIHNTDIVIGTHALIQEEIDFKDLGLVIIDEQHRFGVEQRKTLLNIKDGLSPHFLSMTATPIPRSLALALYGELDISVINEMPKDRLPILTKIVEEDKRNKAYEFIRSQIKIGRQVFVICPLIDISDPLRPISASEASTFGQKSVKEEYEKLSNEIFPDLNIGCLHGRLKAAEKDKIMNDFLNNKINVLVATSVIEVGIDVPNASIIMIEGADKFGLAQLHQFRGRVGRSSHQSYCLLFPGSKSDKVTKRLEALVDHASGFELAKMDLKFRGPGEFYGTAQKGFPELKIASLFDYELMKKARIEAEKIIDIDVSLDTWPALRDKIGEYQNKVHLE